VTSRDGVVGLSQRTHWFINLGKTKEIVFYWPSVRCTLPSVVTGIKHFVAAKLLGVTFCHIVSIDEHVKIFLQFVTNDVISSSVFPAKTLSTTFCALIVSHVLYARQPGRVLDCRFNWQDRCSFFVPEMTYEVSSGKLSLYSLTLTRCSFA